ncbi:MAG: phenylalanine 4-monooxygenase [Alphaproteobacteria bacterium]|nr:phenylalanine 4-monooxygenase [Alphaproteobacteria bacterium]
MEHRADWTIEQNWENYTPQEHQTWKFLFSRQSEILKNRAVPEFLQGIKSLGVAEDGIPDFRRLNDVLMKATGWQIVAVPSLIPDDVFFEHMANRRFVATCFIRRPDQLDYLQEPDVFHDVFGHVPLLVNPIFANYMEAYGKAGIKALKAGHLKKISRLYWYTVEFGLIQTKEGLRIYGSGIVSSKGESIYCLEDPMPRRIEFDLKRILCTDYFIDKYQETYFVIKSFDQLFHETNQDLLSVYDEVSHLPELSATTLLPSDHLIAA